jgi:hypothetical protein
MFYWKGVLYTTCTIINVADMGGYYYYILFLRDSCTRRNIRLF